MRITISKLRKIIREVMSNNQVDVTLEKALEMAIWDEIPANARNLIEQNAVEVYRKLLSKGTWGVSNCETATELWYSILHNAGINVSIIEGHYWPSFEENIEPPLSSDHVWLEIDGKIFDPTAGQFDDIELSNYYVFEPATSRFIRRY